MDIVAKLAIKARLCLKLCIVRLSIGLLGPVRLDRRLSLVSIVGRIEEAAEQWPHCGARSDS